MRAAIARVLAVDERIKRLAIAGIAVRETEFERLARVMQRRIDRLAAIAGQVFHHQVHQAVARLEHLGFGQRRRFQNQFQPRVQVTVMPQPPFDMFGLERDFLENRRVGLESDQRSVRLVGNFPLLFVL